MLPLHSFLDQLRSAGFAISPAIAVEIAEIIPEITTLSQLKLAMRMIICTSRQEQELFDFLFDIEFKPDEPEQEETQDEQPTSDDADYPISLPETGSDADYCPNPGAIASGTVGSNDPSVALVRYASDLKGPARQMMQGNYNNAAAILLRYLIGTTDRVSKFGLQRDLALAQIKDMLDYAVPDHADDLLQRLEQQLDELLRERVASGTIIGRNKFNVQQIEDLPLITLQSGKELHQALRQLGKKLVSKHKRRQKRGNRKINLRQTIRANIQHGGTLLELRQQQKRLDKPKLIVLTDVSTSTIKATRMFLSIIWHAKQVFSDIRFFEFIASTIDVTSEWKRADSVDDAVDGALRRWKQQEFGTQNSDYHQAFTMFQRLFGKRLSSKHTIIVLGDLRDWLGPWKQGSPVSATVMSRLNQQVKRMIVLNPEPEASWNTGDSIVGYVEAKGIEVYETDTLSKLIDVMLNLQ